MGSVTALEIGILSAQIAVAVKREWSKKTPTHPAIEKPNQVHIRYFITSLSDSSPKQLGQLVRGQWSVENLNHHKRDDSVWQEDRHRFRRVNVAQNLALTRNALLAIIPFDENRSLPSLIATYQERKQLAIDLILKARPFP